MSGRWLAHAVRAALAVAALSGVFALAPAMAAGLEVTPTSLTLPAGKRADGLWLSNTGDQPLHAQIRVFRWTQENGEERFEATRALAASPPMLALAPGARQLVRVIRLGAPPAAEEAYRLIVDELPPGDRERQAGLQFVLRYSVPVFLAPIGDATIAPDLRAQLQFDGAQARLAVHNRGSQHAQLADLSFVDAQGGRHAIAPGLLGYALAGQRMRWPLTESAELLRGPGTLKARVNGDSIERTQALDPPPR